MIQSVTCANPAKEPAKFTLPAHWRTKRLKYLLRQRLEYGANEASGGHHEGGIRFVRITDINAQGNLRDDTICNLPETVGREYLLTEGDLLLARSGATVGKSFLYHPSWGRCCYAGYLIRARPNTGLVLPKFVLYYLASDEYWRWISSSLIQATIQNVSAERYASLPVPLPPVTEQARITSYLGCQTARLDALIGRKQHLVALLEEKRAALINRAVTRGLDPGVPLKDSGVPWLGQIPAHWQAKRLKFTLKRIEQGWSPECENRVADRDEWGVLKAGCVNGTCFDPAEHKALPPSVEPLREFEIKPGDILMSRANTRELVGSAAIVGEVRRRLLLCDKLYRLAVDRGQIDADYLVFVLRTSAARYQIERDATGASSSMQNIGQDSVRELLLAVPGIDEQRHIVSWFTALSAKIEQTVVAVREQLARLAEYRTALISAAVTGKIDVRNYATKTEAAAAE